MTKYILKVNGMKCPKCEAHASASLAKLSGAKKVSASHTAGECVFVACDGITEEALREAITSVGYELVSVKCEPQPKKGLFSFLKK